jgi:hypothetical protein
MHSPQVTKKRSRKEELLDLQVQTMVALKVKQTFFVALSQYRILIEGVLHVCCCRSKRKQQKQFIRSFSQLQISIMSSKNKKKKYKRRKKKFLQQQQKSWRL